MPLEPRGALALGMAIHELATNAAKYGASVGAGRQRRRDLDRGFPPGDDENRVDAGLDRAATARPWWLPAKRGFGSVLIERGLAHDLSGEARIEFAATAASTARVHARLWPTTCRTSHPMPGRSRHDAPQTGIGKRVLVVEDELLVAMLVEDMLVRMPAASVVGPLRARGSRRWPPRRSMNAWTPPCWT